MDAFDDPNAAALTTAKPFVGRTIVVRIDSAAAQAPTLVQDLVFMRRLGVRPLIVHDVAQRACASRLVGLINRIGGEAVAIDGASASTIVVSSTASGENLVRSVNAQLLSLLLQEGYIPIFSAEGAAVSGVAAPIDAAEAARVLAAAMHAVRLIYPSETGGIPGGGDGVIGELTSSEALALAEAGTLAPGLAKDLTAAAMSVRNGVDAAQLLDLSVAHASIVELLTAHHLGTQIVSSVVLSN
jgi:acetylglutamate kinase